MTVKMLMDDTDIIIIGGGLSGTYLAYLLEQQGIRYRLLEAKPALGGRIFSPEIEQKNGQKKKQKIAQGVDLGPTWFWAHQHRIKTLLDDFSIPWFEQYTTGDVLYQLHANQPAQKHSGAAALPAYRVQGGMQTLVNGLHATLDVQSVLLSHQVTSIKQYPQGWQLDVAIHEKINVSQKKTSQTHSTQVTSLNTKHIVFAIPPRVLVDTINIESVLPAALVRDLSNTPTWMAAQAKFVAIYERPFWREDGLSGDVFSRVGPLGEIHDASLGDEPYAAKHQTYALFGFLSLPPQARETISEEVLINACVQQLINIFGKRARQPQSVYFKDWATDVRVVTERDLKESPRHPHMIMQRYEKLLNDNHLSFSVTECAEEEAGYLEGALAAAEKTAGRLIDLS